MFILGARELELCDHDWFQGTVVAKWKDGGNLNLQTWIERFCLILNQPMSKWHCEFVPKSHSKPARHSVNLCREMPRNDIYGRQNAAHLQRNLARKLRKLHYSKCLWYIRFGVQLPYPPLLFEMSPSANKSKGFLIFHL